MTPLSPVRERAGVRGQFVVWLENEPAASGGCGETSVPPGVVRGAASAIFIRCAIVRAPTRAVRRPPEGVAEHPRIHDASTAAIS